MRRNWLCCNVTHPSFERNPKVMFGIWPVTNCLNSSANIVDSLLSKRSDPRTSPLDDEKEGDEKEDVLMEVTFVENDPSGKRMSPTTLDEVDGDLAET